MSEFKSTGPSYPETEPIHTPDAVVIIKVTPYDQTFVEDKGIAADGGTGTSSTFGEEHWIDNGDGTFVIVATGSSYSQQVTKDYLHELRTTNLYPSRIDFNVSGTIVFSFSAGITAGTNVSFDVDRADQSIGSQENPLVIANGFDLSSKLIALSKLTKPYLQDGYKVGVYAAFRETNDQGLTTEKLLFVNQELPALRPNLKDNKFNLLSFTIENDYTVSILGMGGVQLSEINLQIEKYIAEYVQPYADALGITVTVTLPMDQEPRTIKPSHSMTFDQVFNSFVVQTRSYTTRDLTRDDSKQKKRKSSRFFPKFF